MGRSSRSAAARERNNDDDDDDDDEEEENAGRRSRRSSRSRQQTVFFSESKHPGRVLVGSSSNDDDNDDDSSGEDGASNESSDEGNNIPIRRKSSRSTAFRGEMKDPSNSIADLMKIADAAAHTSNNRKKRRGARQAKQRSSLEGKNKSDDDDDVVEVDDEDDSAEHWNSPSTRKKPKSSKNDKAVAKSPAKRHSQRRMSKRLEYPQSESSEEENSGDEASEVDSEEEDGHEEEEEIKMSKVIACKLMKLREWKTVCAKMNTTEITNGSRWIQEVDDSVDLDKYEERFLVKWNDLSFLHCSWETEKDLVEFCEGAKTRLSTFFRKAHGGLLFDADERLDGDYFDPSWISIERILEVVSDDDDSDEPAEIILDVNDPNFDSGTGRQFYVKWWNKPYSESSFEFERDLILNDVDYKEPLAQYERRMVKPTREDMRRRLNDGDVQERKLYKIFGDKVKRSDASRDELVKEYQSTLASRIFKNGGQLRDYQAEGVTWLMSNHLNNRGSILADEMGLGKTIQTATYVNTVAEQLATRGPFLVVAPLSTIPHWYREFTGWTDLNTIVYHGSANDRERAREDEFAFPEDRVQDVAFNQRYLMKVAKRWRSNWEKTWMVEVVITTPEMLVTDDFAELAAIKWEILVVDEAHRLKNHNSKLAQNLRDPRFEFNHSLLLTGTPIQNNMQELWTLLNFINPDSFSDLNEFMVQYGDIKSKEKVDELHETIRPYILRRLKEDVEKSVPPKEETLIEVELTVLQKQYYRALYEKNLKFLHRDKRPLDGPSINNLAMQLRKCCNHPFLLKGVENEVKTQNPNTDDVELIVNSSGKFVLLDKLLPRLQADGHRVLLFSQFKIMLDIIEDYLHFRRFKFERIDGSITGMKRQAAIDRFQSKDNGGREQPFIMLLSTRAGGVGINLTAADTCIIVDSDWNPQNDLQAQARCHRIGQTKSVKIYRLLTRKTYEMQMFHMSSMKMGLDQAVLQGIENSGDKDIMTKEEVEKLLKHGAYDIFKEDQEGTSDKASNDFVSQDIDSILAGRAKTVIHDNTGSNSRAAGGTFSKASFKNTSSDGVAAAEIDIDDPEFWSKVVGETKREEDEQLGKRKRAQQSYSEKDYHKRLNAAIRDHGNGSDDEDDNASTSSDWSGDSLEGNSSNPVFSNDSLGAIAKASRSAATERFLWGGSARSDWRQSDAELVLKSLGLFGFGNISWARFNALLPLSKPMKLEEIKRMCWSLILMCLYEAAEDDALEATRKAEAAFRHDLSKGDILARDVGDKVVDVDDSPTKSNADKVDKTDLLEDSFTRLLAANKSWTDLALVMASEYSNTLAIRRDPEYVQSIIDGNHPSKSSDESNAVHSKLVAGFFSNIWPALRSRGWKNDEKNSTRFTHQGNTFKSITAVLDVIPKYHPELVNSAESLISSVKASCDLPSAVDHRHEVRAGNFTAKSLKMLLMDCAPMQLLADRKRAQRITLTKRLLSKLVLLHEVHKAIATADSGLHSEGSLQERNSQLCKVINIHSLSSLPHPEWTLQHDAVLLRAVVKHGWIDSHASCLAIGNDKTIRWGAPFEVSDQFTVEDMTENQTDQDNDKKFEDKYLCLSNTATRAVTFLQQLNETFVDVLPAPILNEIRERTIDSFCLTHGESDENWIVNKSELRKAFRHTEKRVDECEALPSRKKLLKRIKKIAMSLAGTIPDEEKEYLHDNTVNGTLAKKYGLYVIDQSKHENILLAGMIQGLLVMKRSAKVQTVKYYTSLIVGEINARIEDLMMTDVSDSMIQVLEETKKSIHLFLYNQQKHARAAKNILRVMLGKDPIPSKVPTESLFPSEEEKPTAISIAAKAAVTKLKKKKAFTPADNVLVRVLSSIDDADGTNECLHLTSTEILMLTVLSSQGLPPYTDKWGASLTNPALSEDDSQSDDNDEFRIFYFSMTQVMRAAADVWLGIARKKLLQAVNSRDDTKELTDKTREKIAVLKKDHDAKELTYRDAISFSNDPVSFAKKCVVLLEAIRKNMGSVDVQYAGDKKIRQLNKSENGLGTKVLHWFSKDLQKWAASLHVVDKDGNVNSETSITSSKKDHPQTHDAALMSKRDCRTVFIQIAQQTRLRSIFTKNSMEKLSTELIPRVLSQSSFVMTEWEDCPSWWNAITPGENNCHCQDDFDLLCGILDYGYGGFDSLLHHDYSFCRRLAAEEDDDESIHGFTRSSAQIRINHLTRELHANVEREEMMQLVQKKRQVEVEYPRKKPAKSSGGGGVQSGLLAFFVAKRKTPPTSPENGDSDVEIIEIESVGIEDRVKKAKSSD